HEASRRIRRVVHARERLIGRGEMLDDPANTEPLPVGPRDLRVGDEYAGRTEQWVLLDLDAHTRDMDELLGGLAAATHRARRDRSHSAPELRAELHCSRVASGSEAELIAEIARRNGRALGVADQERDRSVGGEEREIALGHAGLVIIREGT